MTVKARDGAAGTGLPSLARSRLWLRSRSRGAKPDPRIAREASGLGREAEQALAHASIAVLVMIGLNGVAARRDALDADRYLTRTRGRRPEERAVLGREGFARADRHPGHAAAVLDIGQLDVEPCRTGRTRQRDKPQRIPN